MPDLPRRQGPVAQLGVSPPRLRSVTVEEHAPAGRLALRGGPEVAAAAARVLGLDLPAKAAAANASASCAALWLGPDEWLLLDFANEPQKLMEALEAALAAIPHSLVDVSHRQTALKLSGRNAAIALNAACPLDLSLSAFPVGTSTRTLFGKAEIVLWRRAENEFHLQAWRSFLGYVLGVLDLACRDAAILDRSR